MPDATESAETIRMIRDSARAVVPADGNLGRVRACRFGEMGFDRETFRSMAEMGWLGMALREEAGGLALGMGPLAALCETLGTGLVPEPLAGAVLACTMIEEPPAAMLSGERIVLAAWQDEANSLEWRHGARLSGGNRVSGRKAFVPCAAGADAFAVATGTGIAIVARDARGLRLELTPTRDGGHFGELVMDDVEAEVLAGADVDAALDAAILCHAAYLLGVADAAFDMTLEYLRIRHQFGKPIGSFQALQHRATDLKVRIELTRASVGAAAVAMDGGSGSVPAAAIVSQAKARATDTAMLVAREAIQMHGAIGFTDEYDVGLFARKAMAQGNLFGSAALHRRRYASLVPMAEAA
jgi:alkylation response protein AidB-like acyl-CoA dehydrogenase